MTLSACYTAVLHAQAVLLQLQVPASPEAKATGRPGRPGQLVQERRSVQQASCGATLGQAADPAPAASSTAGTQVRPSHAVGQCIPSLPPLGCH